MQPNQPVTLASLREEYTLGGLDEADLEPDPFAMLQRWLDEAIRAGLYDPTGMVVSTVSATGRPSSRMVLLKGHSDEGFVFFTNQESRKGVELAANPRCALLFPWHPLERQVRIEGEARDLGREAVEAYFRARPRGSQLGAWASDQSRPVDSREELAAAYARVEEQHGEGEVPVPPQWGGYLVVPEAVEFWQGRPGRMHDRFVYARAGAGWTLQRLAP